MSEKRTSSTVHPSFILWWSGGRTVRSLRSKVRTSVEKDDLARHLGIRVIGRIILSGPCAVT